MTENQNFTVTVNDASETIYVDESQPAEVKTPPDKKSGKGVIEDAPVIP